MVKRRSKSIHTEERHHFFKIMFPGFSTRRLRIPPEFVEHISMEAYKFATLEDSNGNHWRVTLNKTTSGTYIEDGWRDFITDQSIYDNNFLVFGYDGNTCFDVNVFDESGCERDYVFSTKPNQEPDFSDEVKSFETSTDYVQKSITDDPGKLFPTFKPKGLKKAKKENVELIHEPLSKTTCSASRIYRKKCSVSRRRPATEEEKAKVRKEAESFTSKFPHFSRCLTAANVYQGFVLPIPNHFAKKHIHFQGKAKVTLWNRKGQAWRVNILHSGKSRMITVLCGGWPAFVHANKLEEADICIFEVVGNLEMHVHIFRAVKES